MRLGRAAYGDTHYQVNILLSAQMLGDLQRMPSMGQPAAVRRYRPKVSQKSQLAFSSPAPTAIVWSSVRCWSAAVAYAGHIGSEPPFGLPVVAKRVQYLWMARDSDAFPAGTLPSSSLAPKTYGSSAVWNARPASPGSVPESVPLKL